MSNLIDINALKDQWIADFGGDYPDDFVERYLAFVGIMSGMVLDSESLLNALVKMDLPKEAMDQIEYYRNLHKTGGIYEQVRIEVQKIIGWTVNP